MNRIHWNSRRTITNKFVRKFRYAQHAYHDVSYILVPFTADSKLDNKRTNDLICAFSNKHGYRSGGIVGSSYGSRTMSVAGIRQYSDNRGVMLVSESVGIGE